MDESDDYDYPDDEVEFPDVDGDFHDCRSVAGDELQEEEEKKVPAKKRDPRMTFLFNKIDEDGSGKMAYREFMRMVRTELKQGAGDLGLIH